MQIIRFRATDEQVRKLSELARATGRTMSGVLRRLLSLAEAQPAESIAIENNTKEN